MSVSSKSAAVIGALLALSACTDTGVAPVAVPMTGPQIAATIPGHTWQTHQEDDGRLIVQRYSPGTDHGTFVGVYGEEANKGTWRIKGDKWCENWGDGGGCWGVVPVSMTELQLIQDGVPLPDLFTFVE